MRMSCYYAALLLLCCGMSKAPGQQAPYTIPVRSDEVNLVSEGEQHPRPRSQDAFEQIEGRNTR